MNKIIVLSTFFIFLLSCQRGEEKYFYYKDERGYIHKQFFVSSDKQKAIKLHNMYKKLKVRNLVDFERTCVINGYGCIESKKKGEIIRLYPELGIAKVLFRFTNQELNAPLRIDVRKRKYYVPLILLQDTIPKLDTIKYIP